MGKTQRYTVNRNNARAEKRGGSARSEADVLVREVMHSGNDHYRESGNVSRANTYYTTDVSKPERDTLVTVVSHKQLPKGKMAESKPDVNGLVRTKVAHPALIFPTRKKMLRNKPGQLTQELASLGDKHAVERLAQVNNKLAVQTKVDMHLKTAHGVDAVDVVDMGGRKQGQRTREISRIKRMLPDKGAAMILGAGAELLVVTRYAYAVVPWSTNASTLGHALRHIPNFGSPPPPGPSQPVAEREKDPELVPEAQAGTVVGAKSSVPTVMKPQFVGESWDVDEDDTPEALNDILMQAAKAVTRQGLDESTLSESEAILLTEPHIALMWKRYSAMPEFQRLNEKAQIAIRSAKLVEFSEGASEQKAAAQKVLKERFVGKEFFEKEVGFEHFADQLDIGPWMKAFMACKKFLTEEVYERSLDFLTHNWHSVVKFMAEVFIVSVIPVGQRVAYMIARLASTFADLGMKITEALRHLVPLMTSNSVISAILEAFSSVAGPRSEQGVASQGLADAVRQKIESIRDFDLRSIAEAVIVCTGVVYIAMRFRDPGFSLGLAASLIVKYLKMLPDFTDPLGLVEWVVKTSGTMVDAISRAVETKSFKGLFDDESAVSMAELEAAGTLDVQGTYPNIFFRTREEFIHKLEREFSRLREKAILKEQPYLSRWKSFCEMRSNVSANMQGRFRPAPFTLLFYGPSCVGKTFIMSKTAEVLAYTYLKRALRKHEICYYNGTDRYYSNYMMDTIVFIADDIAQARPGTDPNVQSPVYMIINLCNNTAVPLTFADLERKGKIYFMAPLILCTTNNKGLDAAHYASEPLAIMRRFNYVITVEVREGCRAPNSQMINKDLMDTIDPRVLPDNWSFKLEKAHAGQGREVRYRPIYQNLSLAQMLAQLQVDLVAHFAHEEKARAATDTNVTSVEFMNRNGLHRVDDRGILIPPEPVSEPFVPPDVDRTVWFGDIEVPLMPPVGGERVCPDPAAIIAAVGDGVATQSLFSPIVSHMEPIFEAEATAARAVYVKAANEVKVAKHDMRIANSRLIHLREHPIVAMYQYYYRVGRQGAHYAARYAWDSVLIMAGAILGTRVAVQTRWYHTMGRYLHGAWGPRLTLLLVLSYAATQSYAIVALTLILGVLSVTSQATRPKEVRVDTLLVGSVAAMGVALLLYKSGEAASQEKMFTGEKCVPIVTRESIADFVDANSATAKLVKPTSILSTEQMSTRTFTQLLDVVAKKIVAVMGVVNDKAILFKMYPLRNGVYVTNAHCVAAFVKGDESHFKATIVRTTSKQWQERQVYKTDFTIHPELDVAVFRCVLWSEEDAGPYMMPTEWLDDLAALQVHQPSTKWVLPTSSASVVVARFSDEDASLMVPRTGGLPGFSLVGNVSVRHLPLDDGSGPFPALCVDQLYTTVKGDCGAPLLLSVSVGSSTRQVIAGLLSGVFVDANFSPVSKRRQVFAPLTNKVYTWAIGSNVVEVQGLGRLFGQPSTLTLLPERTNPRLPQLDTPSMQSLGVLVDSSGQNMSSINTFAHTQMRGDLYASRELDDIVGPVGHKLPHEIEGGCRSDEHYAKPLRAMAKADFDPNNVFPAILQKAQEDLFVSYLAVYVQLGSFPLHPNTIFTACNTDGLLTRLDLTTAAGFGRKGSKAAYFDLACTKNCVVAGCTKYHPRVCDGVTDVYIPGTVNYYPNESLLAEVNELIEHLKNGVTDLVVVKASLKDEVIGVDATKIRAFYVSATALNIVIRMFLMPLIMPMAGKAGYECMSGVDPYTKAWDSMYAKMETVGHSQRLGGDYGSFDLLTNVQLLDAYYETLVQLAICSGWSTESVNIVRNLGYNLARPVYVVQGQVFRVQGSNPSGIAITTHANSGVNALIHRYAFYLANPQFLLVPPKVDNMSRFQYNVVLFTYGDDVIGACYHRPCVHSITNWDVRDAAAAFGMKYGPMDKTLDADGNARRLPLYYEQDELQFLKNVALYVPECGFRIGAISKTSVRKCLSFERAGATKDRIRSAYASGLRLYWPHAAALGPAEGRQAYERLRDVCADALLRKYSVTGDVGSPDCDALLPTYDDVLYSVRSNSCAWESAQ